MKGGAVSRSWVAKTTLSRTGCATRQPVPAGTKCRCSRSGPTSSAIRAGYTARRATSMASALRSVAKICTGTRRSGSSAAITSSSTLASEYASSPVEHPATQARKGSPAGRCCRSAGNTQSGSERQTDSSRKKAVTPISSSRASRATSWGLARSKAR